MKPIKRLTCPSCGVGLEINDADPGIGQYQCGNCGTEFARKLKI